MDITQTLNQIEKLQKQATLLVRQNEQKIREQLQEVFETGLSLLGHGIVLGRKASEAFVAETHRKAEKLKQQMEGRSAMKNNKTKNHKKRSQASVSFRAH